MRFNLKELNPAITLPLDEENENAGSIDLRIMNAAKMEELRKKYIKTRWTYHKGQRHEVQDIDNASYDRALWDYCISGWEGVEDETGTPIPPTAENKYTLMQESPLFSRLVRERLEQIQDEQIKRQKDAEKN